MQYISTKHCKYVQKQATLYSKCFNNFKDTITNSMRYDNIILGHIVVEYANHLDLSPQLWIWIQYLHYWLMCFVKTNIWFGTIPTEDNDDNSFWRKLFICLGGIE